ncbi:MAG: phage holin family protein [Prevotella sp.]
MFSNDNNINTIAQLVEAIKRNIGLQGEYLKLDLTEKTVRLLTAILLLLIFALVLLAIMTYISFAAAFALAEHIGISQAFCVVALAYVLVLIICMLFKKQLIEKPLVRFFASLLS